MPETLKADPNGGAVQFYRFEELPPEVQESIRRKRVKQHPRWRSPAHPDMGTVAATKSEARAWFKQHLGKLPVGFMLERY